MYRAIRSNAVMLFVLYFPMAALLPYNAHTCFRCRALYMCAALEWAAVFDRLGASRAPRAKPFFSYGGYFYA